MPIKERVLLTVADVAEWKAQERDLLDQLKAVRKKLEGARLMGIDVGDDEPKDGGEVLIEGIERVVRAAGKALSHDEIRNKLRLNPKFAENLSKSPNYYYTQLDRLIQREKIVRVGKLFKTNEAPEGES